MFNEGIAIEEITQRRTPLELLNWIERKLDQIEPTDEGERFLRLHEGLAKQLMEEVYPLAIFRYRKFGNTDQVLLQSIIGNQSYDAIMTDLRNKPSSQSYIEITQSHEGESDYLRRFVLQKKGFAFMHGPVIKRGTKKTGMQVSIPAIAVTPNEVTIKELEKIVDAAKRKAVKDYPADTSLIIVFHDDRWFRQTIDDADLDTYVKEHILNLDLRFSKLYLVGWHNVLKEFSLVKRT